MWLYASILVGMELSEKDRAPQDADKFIVRLPAGMRDLLRERAAANNRSMNAEIVSRLSKTLDEDLTSALTKVSDAMSTHTIDSILDIMLDRLKERESGAITSPPKTGSRRAKSK